MEPFLAFLAVAAVVIVTPGQDTALTVRNTLLGGRRGGVSTAAGVASGQAVWTVTASAGLAALVVASEPLFQTLRLAGAAYLVVLGLAALRDAWRGRTGPANGLGVRRLRPRAAYRQGLLSNLGNPKMVIFFTGLLPQFAGREPGFLGLLALGLLFCVLTLAWLCAYAAAVAKARSRLEGSRVRRALDAVTGAVLVALGLRLATPGR